MREEKQIGSVKNSRGEFLASLGEGYAETAAEKHLQGSQGREATAVGFLLPCT